MRLAGLITTFAVIAAVVIAGSAAPAAAADVNFYSVVNEFMCTTCHEPLAQVDSPQAVSEKDTLRGFIARGLTVAQIRRAMIAQYGPQVLAAPAAAGFGLTIYVVPPAVLLAGLALLAYTLPKWRERARRAAATHLAPAPALAPQDARRLDDELERFL